MGISWSSGSNRRRNNNYFHHPPPPPPPPPHQYLPSPFVYTSEPPSLPPPPQNYAYPSNPSYTPPAPPPPYPPPPPPNYTSYYYSTAYDSCNYANPMMGRSNYPPYYANQINGWAAIRPMVVQAQAPPPYVDHQNAKKVRNDVNVHKDTFRIEVDELNPDYLLVSFVFDALSDGSITIYYFAREEPGCRFVPLFPEAYTPFKVPFQKGLGQKFQQPPGTGIDLGFFELDDLSKPSPGEEVFPLVIAAETGSLPDHNGDSSSDPMPSTSSNMQITQAVLEKNNGGPFQVRVMKQILWIDGMRYELREIYGIESSESQGFDDSDPGKECVICMTEPKDTAVLPCRHMCMCSECAKELRLRSDKCPICRQPIQELIEIKINNS